MSLVAVAKRYLFQTKSQELVLRLALLCMIYIYAFAIRLVRVHRLSKQHALKQHFLHGL